MLKVKSVYEPIRSEDGLRILATRYRGRGMRKSRYSLWMASLGPSERLFRSGSADWRGWKKRYREEILGSDTREPKNPHSRNRGQKFTLRLIKYLARHQTVTLMCHCPKDATRCHWFVLRDIIRGRGI